MKAAGLQYQPVLRCCVVKCLLKYNLLQLNVIGCFIVDATQVY